MKHTPHGSASPPAAPRARAPRARRTDEASRPAKHASEGRSPAAPFADATASDTQARDSVVRQVAYGFYEARGRLDGHDLRDWLDAEAQIGRATAESIEAPTDNDGAP